MKSEIKELIKLLYIKLNEDLLSDLDDDEDDDDSDYIINRQNLKEVEKVATQIEFNNSNSWLYSSVDKSRGIYAEKVDDDSFCLYYDSNQYGKKKMLNSISCESIESAQKLIDAIYRSGYTKCLTNFIVKPLSYNNNFYSYSSYCENETEPDEIKTNILDFKNHVQFSSFMLSHVHPINLNFHEINDNNKLYSFYQCYMDDSIHFDNVNKIEILQCVNLKDFSFVDNIKDKINICYSSSNTVPSTYNLAGLPSGNYNIGLTYSFLGRNRGVDTYDNMSNTLSFIGWPNGTKLECRVTAAPILMFQHISFEGINNSNVNDFQFKADMPTQKEIVIQMGPNNFTKKGRRYWSPNKAQLDAIIKTQDWFFDAYEKGSKPHKTYVTPDNDISQKLQNKSDKANQKKQQKKQDDLDDMNAMVERCKKYLHANDTFKSDYLCISIVELKDTTIRFWFYNYTYGLTRMHRYCYTYQDFVKKIIIGYKENDFCFDDNGNKIKSIYDLIVKPVLNKREKIKLQRKQEAKEQHQLERERKKAEAKALKNKSTDIQDTPEDFDTNDVITAEQPVKTANIQKSNTNVQIVDYNDRSIAVIGPGTYDIRQELKDAGCRFNKYLNIDGNKKAGWIISKTKRNKIEEIINKE